MKNTTVLRAGLITLILGHTGTALAKEGWYAGFNIGSHSNDIDTPTINLDPPAPVTVTLRDGLDDNDVGFVLNGGYRMNSLLALNLDFSYTYTDARLSYRDDAFQSYSHELIVESFYLTPGVHLFYPINQDFEVYGKLGLSIILTDLTNRGSGPGETFTESIKDWDIAPTLGFGGQWQFGKNWAAIAEYTITQSKIAPLEGDGSDLSGTDIESQNILVGLRYHFD